MSKKNITLILRIVETACWTIGPFLLALNLAAVKSSKGTYYFVDANEWGIAIGVLLISGAYVVKKWM